MLLPIKRSNFALVIELERHIEILLLSNDCVIVPGLGGFMAHHIDARYDDRDHTFLPPLRTLGFNPQLQINDSLLVQSYIEAYDISYPDALNRIEDEVNELKQHLSNDGVYELNDIGVLTINDEGNIIFEPCEAGILTPELYGLGLFEMHPLSMAKVAQHAQSDGDKIKQETETTALVQEEPQPAAQAAEVEMNNKPQKDTIEIKTAWIRNTVAVAAALLAFLIFSTPLGNSNMKDLNISKLQNNILFRLMPKDTNIGMADTSTQLASKYIQARKDSIAQAAAVAKEAQRIDSITAAQQARPYSIVLASQITRRNALRYTELLEDLGFDKARVYIHNHVVRVVYGSYASKDEAYKALRGLRGNEHFEEAWVLKTLN